MALTKITDEILRLEKSYEGYNGISLTNFDNTSEPKIANGSVIEIGGSIFEASGGDESITGWAGIGNGNDVFIEIDPNGSASFTIALPSWNTARHGYYNGNNRIVAGLYKYDATTYINKFIYADMGIKIFEHNSDRHNYGALLYHIQHKTIGNGGTTVTGVFTTRPLNYELITEISGASLSSNQITLPFGKYYIEWYSYGTSGINQTRFRNITDGATEIIGEVDGGAGSSKGYGKFTIYSTKIFELQHWVGAGLATTGFGADANTGEDNIFADILIWRVG